MTGRVTFSRLDVLRHSTASSLYNLQGIGYFRSTSPQAQTSALRSIDDTSYFRLWVMDGN